jgi:putative ABC transport system permease protein
MGQNSFVEFAVRYAGRNLLRNRRRTILTISTVALSVAVSNIGTRYSTAVLKIWQDGSINHGTAHAQIHAKGYFDRPDVISVERTIPKDDDFQKNILSDSDIESVTRRIVFEGIISAGPKTIYFLGRGVDPDSERKVSPDVFADGVDQGQFVSNLVPNGIVIGSGLAETLGLKIGDDATLMVNTLNGTVNGVDVKVAGFVSPPLPGLSKRLVYAHVDFVQQSIKLEDRFSQLAIRLKPGAGPEKFVERYQTAALAAGLDLRGWWQLDPMIRKVEKIWDSVVGVICFLLFVSAGISVLNIIFMLVAERTVEIGTLMAIGAKPRDIKFLFASEAILIGTIGGIIGGLIANVALKIMDIVGVPFDSPFSSGVLLVHPQISIVVTGIIVIAGIIICYLSALAPARKAAAVEPVIAFRGQIT